MSVSPELSSLPLLWESKELIALLKPSGLPSQPLAEAPDAPSASGYAKLMYPDIASAGPHPLEGGLLHRLDVGTSGILLFARDRATYDSLKSLWKTNQVLKHYRAVVTHPPQALSSLRLPQLIEIPLGHSAKSRSRMLAVANREMLRRIRGKPLQARTWIESVIAQGSCLIQSAGTGSPSTRAQLADLHLRIETGVMHQIRCHLSHLEMPLLGDSRYQGLPHERLWLHAWKIELKMGKGAPILIEAPLPENWPLSTPRA